MPEKAAKVVITEWQRVILAEVSRSRSESQMISQRPRIILLAFAGRSNRDISLEAGFERKQVGLWRRRWRDAWDALTLFECSEPRRLLEAVRDTLKVGQGFALSPAPDDACAVPHTACSCVTQARCDTSPEERDRRARLDI